MAEWGVERLDPRIDTLLAPGAWPEPIAAGLGWAEGPVWDRQDDSLLFSDVINNVVLRWRSGRGVSVFLQDSGYDGCVPFDGKEPGANGLAFDAAGRLILCEHGRRRVSRLEADGKRTTLATHCRGLRLNSPNDVVVHSSGDIYFTDPPYGLPRTFTDPARAPVSGVLRIVMTEGGGVDLLDGTLQAPNGLAFSPDERRLYLSQSGGQHPAWFAYEVGSGGTLGRRRLFVDAARFADRPGSPDGLKIDQFGNLFAAGPGGVYIFAPDGSHLGTVLTGTRTGNVAWGEDGGTLFVAAEHCVLRLRMATRGAGF